MGAGAGAIPGAVGGVARGQHRPVQVCSASVCWRVVSAMLPALPPEQYGAGLHV